MWGDKMSWCLFHNNNDIKIKSHVWKIKVGLKKAFFSQVKALIFFENGNPVSEIWKMKNLISGIEQLLLELIATQDIKMSFFI